MTRRRRIALLVAAPVVLACALALAQGTVTGERPPCVEAQAIVRATGFAYNHWVRVRNGCDERATCRVSTDVNPEETRLMVDPGETEEVLTFRGSPASAFTATVDCALDD
ncbi:MAG: hypothetical protein ACFCGT_24420 [Sandaracinaceae bacterium]